MATSRAGALENVGRIVGGRYRLRAAIGSGGTAQVYLAEDTTLHRAVAVKVLHPELGADRSFIDRFRREARAAARLEHDHIVAVYDHGEDVDAGTPRAWLVMQYLAGGSLRSVLDSGQRLSPSQAAVVGIAAARGLAYAHEHGFVHRDVKPANLLFGRDGRLRIADFGLARAIDASSLTEPAGLVLGTARYASPEQVLRRPLDGRTDVYSLALVLIEAVTGKVPFAGDDLIASLQHRTEVDLAVPPELGALVPVLTEAGRRDPSRRLDAAGVARALVALRRELPAPETIRLVAPAPVDGVVDLTEALPEPMAGIAPVRRRRSWPRRLLVSLVAVVLLAGAVAAAAIVVSRQGEDPIPTHVVPTLVGRTEAQATALLGGLEFEVVRSERRQDGTTAGEVLSQDPAPGVELAEGGVLTIVVSLGPNPVAVPAVIGSSEADARAGLEAVGLEVGEVFTTASEDVPAGTVLDIAPKDTMLEPGTAIDLNVSSGPAPRTVPALVGLTVDEATTALAAIQLGVEVEEVYDDTVEKGRIVSTEPAPDQQVPRDSAVRLLVSKGPELVVVPSVSGFSLGGAVDAIEAAGLTAGQVYGPARGTPISTNPDAGSKVKKGTVVDIYLG